MQSMTGFAAKTITLVIDKDHKANLTLQLKSLNSRFIEINCRLTHALSHLEHTFIKMFKNRLHRGYIHYTIYVDNPSIFKGNVKPSMSTITDYITAINEIKNKFDLQDTLSINTLLNLPNVFSLEEVQLDDETTKPIIDATNDLIDAVIAEREKEGALLAKDIEQRIGTMQQAINEIADRSQKLIEEQKEKVQRTLEELGDDESALADARKSAVYAVLDKIDIHEEIVRFKSHLTNLKDHLDRDSIEKGKQLDFTLQELAREINTITAKCSDTLISSLAITTKVELEKAREQAQNLV